MRYAALALALVAAAAAAEARADVVHFLVAERPDQAAHHDSFVLPLDDPEAIAHARALITQGPEIGRPIVHARIAAGADGVNRDYLAPGAPEWSWHVTDFLDFADLTVEILDGWPGYVEGDVPGWIANTGGEIGFWGYTVTAELPVVPEPGALELGAIGGLALLACAYTRRRLGRARGPERDGPGESRC
jgi:hypothetical protein